MNKPALCRIIALTLERIDKEFEPFVSEVSNNHKTLVSTTIRNLGNSKMALSDDLRIVIDTLEVVTQLLEGGENRRDDIRRPHLSYLRGRCLGNSQF